MPVGVSAPTGIPGIAGGMTPSRRRFLAAAVATATALLPLPARATEFTIDWQGAAPDPAVRARLHRHIAMVRASPVRADVLAFWAAEVIHVQTRPGEPSRAGGRLFITRDPFPDDDPVLLHELIHRWHFARLARTPRVQPLRDAFAAERAAPHWPDGAYMYRNIGEYLAMCASVAIHGGAARPPFTRDQVRAKLPATWDFIVTEFGLRA